MTAMVKRKLSYTYVLLISLFFSAIPCATIALADTQTIYGYVENVTILPEALTLKARIDTGASTASLYATNIESFQQGEETWVRFDVPTSTGLLTPFTRKIERISRIKGRIDESSGQTAPITERPVVKMTLCIGNQSQVIEVSLANRKNLLYPVLIGRTALIKFNAIVDPGAEFKQKLECDEQV